ncbi:glycosyltransferase [soil metagenome]
MVAKKSVVLVYRDHLLSPSETFIMRQAEALKEFVPYYVGSRRVEGLPLPEDRTILVNRGGFLGKLSEMAFRFRGPSSKMVRRVQGLNPALIHAHFGPDSVKALSLSRALRIPLVVTFHGYDATVRDEYARHSFHSHRVYLRHRELLQREANQFIAVSKFIKNSLIEFQRIPSEKIVVHYIGVDTKVFQPHPEVLREPTVLFVGRLVEKKGCEYLIRAMSRVQAVMPEANLVVIGDGPLRAPLEQQARATLRKYSFLGTQSLETVRMWMNRAKVFSVPSITAQSGDSEGLPTVFVEAQAIGTPVASFVSNGIPEAVLHNETGFLAPEGDWMKLADSILLLLTDEGLWRRFSKAGQSRANGTFNIREQTRKLERVYAQVLDK